MRGIIKLHVNLQPNLTERRNIAASPRYLSLRPGEVARFGGLDGTNSDMLGLAAFEEIDRHLL